MQLFVVGTRSGQPQTDDARFRQVGQFDVLRQLRLEVGELVREVALADARALQHLVQYGVFVVEDFLQSRQNFLTDKLFHLERHAGKGDQNLAVLLYPESRGSTQGVLQDGAACGHVGLVAVGLREFHPTGGENLAHPLQGRLVHHQFAVEVVADDLFGDVVAGGSESAGDHNQVGFRKSVLDGAADGVLVVADGDAFCHFDARQGHLLPDEGGVGVDDLS